MSTLTIETLGAAIKTGDFDAVASLVEEAPSLLRERTAEGATPIILALYMQQSHLMPILLAHATDIDVFEAAGVGREVRLAELLNADASLALAYAPDGFTALHLAAFFGSDAAANVLLEHGADPNASARNAGKVQPLHSAAAGRHLAIAGALIAAGANVNAQQHGGYTPLHAAAQHGDRAFVDLLLASGAYLALRTDDGKSASDFSMDACHAAIAELLRPR